ncbi:MAG: SIR2 family protein [Myxococcales bacterium]|nr:SIR2 family protein [Myxococcales bacterium]
MSNGTQHNGQSGGTPPQSDTTCRLSCRLRRLVGRIVDRRVVPFVGAGFSAGARIPGEPGFVPSAPAMHGRIAKLIPPGNATARAGRKESGRLDGKDVNTSTLNLAKIAEIASWFSPLTEIMQAAQISKFAELQPTACHRYLAYMVREGWVTDVMSTNYDTCIETAYRESFGNLNTQDTLRVITSLEHYTDYGAEAQMGTEPVLHLYKLNGCAQDYAYAAGTSGDHGRHRLAAERILLTERQLQKLRSDGWKHALIGHVGRTRTLLFSGFGAEEPQIRHTVLALVDEFSAHNDGRGRSRTGRDPDCQDPDGLRECAWLNSPCHRPHAPYVTMYDAEPSFPQSQLLQGFIDAYRPQETPPPRDSTTTRVFDLIIGGRDHSALSAEPKRSWFRGLDDPTGNNHDPNNLSADLLWKRLYQLAIVRVLRTDLHRSDFPRWLRDAGIPNHGVAAILDRLEQWLSDRTQDQTQVARSHLCDCLRDPTTLWEPRDDSGGRWQPLLWMELLTWMKRFPTLAESRGGNHIPKVKAEYHPYRQDRLQWWITLALVYFLGEHVEHTDDHVPWTTQPGFGPVFSLNANMDKDTDSNHSTLRVALVSEDSPNPPRNAKDGLHPSGGRGRHAIRILIPTLGTQIRRGRMEYRVDHMPLHIGEYATVPASLVFERAIWPTLEGASAGDERYSETANPPDRQKQCFLRIIQGLRRAAALSMVLSKHHTRLRGPQP